MSWPVSPDLIRVSQFANRALTRLAVLRQDWACGGRTGWQARSAPVIAAVRGTPAGGCFDAQGLLLRIDRGDYRVRARVALSIESGPSGNL